MTSTYKQSTVDRTSVLYTTANVTPISLLNGSIDDYDGNEDDVEGYTSFIKQTTPYVAAIDVIAGLGVIGNILIIMLMTSSTLRRHSYAVYLIFLAVSDSFVLFMIAVEDNTDHIFHKLDTMFNSHIIICKTWTFVQEFVKVLSPWILVAMTFDRFIIVVFPLHKVRVCTVRCSLSVCIGLCLVSGILNAPYLYYLQYHPEEEIKEGYICDIQDINMDYYYMTMATLIQSVLPVILLITANVQTAVILRRTANSTLRRTKSLDEAKLMKITISLILVSVLSAVALVPFAITSFVEYILILTGSDERTIQFFSDLWMVFNVIRLLNYAMNFYVLVSFSDQYRSILVEKFTCSCCKHKDREEYCTSSMGINSAEKTDTTISTVTESSSAL